MGVIKQVFVEEGIPYLQNETQKIFLKDIQSQFLPRISAWILQANRIMTLDTSLRTKVFNSNGMAGGITTVDSRSTRSIMSAAIRRNEGQLLKDQWDDTVLKAQQNMIALQQIDLNTEQVLKEGYRILTQIGEMIRGDTISYRVVIRNESFTKVYDYMLSLDEFLNDIVSMKTFKGQVSNSALGLKSFDQLTNINTNRREWSDAEISNFQLFMAEVRGYHEYHGKIVMHPLKPSANEGQLLEAYLNSGFKAQFSEADIYWKNFKPIAKRILAASARLSTKEALADPSPFWQGGEGGKYLQNIQVKGKGGNMPTLRLLVRQMTRINQILNNIGTKVKEGVKNKSIATVNISDEEALEAIINMFEREGWKALSVNWTI